MNKRIKIAFVGNIANNFFREAKALQGSKLLSVDLFFHPIEGDSTVLPESDQPSLNGNYPSWIKIYPGFKKNAIGILFFYLGFKNHLKNKNQEWIDTFNKYDLCVFSSFDSCFIPFLRTKSVFRATGSDLTVHPLFTYNELNELRNAKVSCSIYTMARAMIYCYLNRYLVSYSIRASDYVDIGFGAPFLRAADRLSVPDRKRLGVFRLAIDTEVFVRRERNQAARRFGLRSGEFYVCLPSRIMLRQTPALVDTGQWKASDRALEGFGIFLSLIPKEARNRVKLLIPDRTLSNDLHEAKQLVCKLSLETNVVFVRGASLDSLTRDELIDLYSLSAAVLDDFGAGWYGSIVVEAMSCSTPVITYVPDSLMQTRFPWHPIQIAQTPMEISARLFKLYSDQAYANRVESESREWILEFHSNQSVKKRLEQGLLELNK